LNLDRSLRPSRRAYVIEERGEGGSWIERDRFGSYDEAAEAFDRLSVASEANLRIRWLDPRHRLNVAAAVVGAVLILAVAAWWVAYLLTEGA
jgi:hypothetical protein